MCTFTHIDTCAIYLHWNSHTQMTFRAIFQLYLVCNPAVASVVFLCLALKLKFNTTCICYFILLCSGDQHSYLRIAIAQVVQGFFFCFTVLACGVLGCARNCFCSLKTSLYLTLWLSFFIWSFKTCRHLRRFYCLCQDPSKNRAVEAGSIGFLYAADITSQPDTQPVTVHKT